MLVDGNNVISHYLKKNIPFAAGKIGVTELNILQAVHNNVPNAFDYLRHEVEDIAGLYPFNKETGKKFYDDMVNRLKDVDLIPQWNRVNPQFEKYIFDNWCPQAHKNLLQHLEPYFFDKPWTDHLKGKKVLVISPFAESIERNFQNLDKIWNGKIRPNFELKAYAYPFALTLNGPDQRYSASDQIYQEFLQLLRQEMPKHDVGIFGTGYTSLLFTTECKRLGKAGIHLGGSTQILFGIKGQRWREIKEFQPFFNEYWTDPLSFEIPEDYKKVEGGCYW